MKIYFNTLPPLSQNSISFFLLIPLTHSYPSCISPSLHPSLMHPPLPSLSPCLLLSNPCLRYAGLGQTELTTAYFTLARLLCIDFTAARVCGVSPDSNLPSPGFALTKIAFLGLLAGQRFFRLGFGARLVQGCAFVGWVGCMRVDGTRLTGF